MTQLAVTSEHSTKIEAQPKDTHSSLICEEMKTTAVDEGFDFVNFPELSVPDQIASIPAYFLEQITFD